MVEIFQIVCECFSILVDRKIHPETEKKPLKAHNLIESSVNNTSNKNFQILNECPSHTNDSPNGTENIDNSQENTVPNSSYA